MVIYKGRSITLKHFLLSPVIAASAGYDFNIGDVISFQVNGWLKLTGQVCNWFYNLPDCRVGDLPKELFSLCVTLIFVLSYPILFLPFAFVGYHLIKKSKHVEYSEILRLCAIVEKMK